MPKFNNTANRELVQRVPPPQEVPVWVKELAKSKVIHALESSLAAVVFVPAIELFLGNPIQASLPWISLVVALSFGLVIICNWLHLGAKNLHAFAAIVEAHAEILLNRDLNGSGAIGDNKMIEGKSEVIEENAENPKLTRAAFLRHVEEFSKRAAIEGIGLSRSQWLRADGAKENYRFASDGDVLTRQEYEDIIKILDVRGRRQGKAGQPPTLPE